MPVLIAVKNFPGDEYITDLLFRECVWVDVLERTYFTILYSVNGDVVFHHS
jgi:hypothetical protein